MATPSLVADIQWRTGLAEGLQLARAQRKAVVLKPLGQGLGDCDHW